MKIKLKTARGSHTIGQIIDAAKNPISGNFMSYDSLGTVWYYMPTDCEEVIEEISSEPKSIHTSIRDLIGQDMARIEFK